MYKQTRSEQKKQVQASISRQERNRNRISNAILITVFILMCILRLWYTVFLVFGLGLILTLKDRRRSFCGSYCPMGTMQEGFYPEDRSPKSQRSEKEKIRHQYQDREAAERENTRKVRVHRFLQKQWVKILSAAVFWGYLGAVLYIFWGDAEKLWYAMFGLMMGSLAIAVLLQRLSRKRVWCSTICPYGSFLQKTVKFR